jgi:hypothetical protein
MASSAVQLCSRALTALGATPIASFQETSAEAQVCRQLYAGLRDALLSAHPWSFAMAQARLPRLAAQPVADFAHAFQLPPDFLRALSAGSGRRGRGVAYRIAERRLHADVDGVVLTYVYRPREPDFPPFFDQALAARLAAEFCLPLTESTSRAEALSRLAEAEFRRARQIDAQQETPAAFEDFPLIEAHAR